MGKIGNCPCWGLDEDQFMSLEQIRKYALLSKDFFKYLQLNSYILEQLRQSMSSTNIQNGLAENWHYKMKTKYFYNL